MTENLQYDGGLRRLGARFIDGIATILVGSLCMIICIVVYEFLEQFNATLIMLPITLGMIIFFTVFVIGNSFFFFRKTGQTFGKIITGIKIVDRDGQVPATGMLFVRELIYNVISSFISVFGVITIPFTDKRQALHDMVLHTFVVLDPNRRNKGLRIFVIFAIIGLCFICNALTVAVLPKPTSCTSCEVYRDNDPYVNTPNRRGIVSKPVVSIPQYTIPQELQ